MRFRLGEEPVHVATTKKIALTGGGLVQHVSHEGQKWAAQVLESWDGEVALRPVDHLRRHNGPPRLLEDVLSAVPDLEVGRDPTREFDEVMVEERNARLKTPGHGHVVDSLHRIVDEHDLGVDTQGLVDGPVRAWPGE